MLNCIACIDLHVKYGSNNLLIDQYLLVKKIFDRKIDSVFFLGYVALLRTLYTTHIICFTFKSLAAFLENTEKTACRTTVQSTDSLARLIASSLFGWYLSGMSI